MRKMTVARAVLMANQRRTLSFSKLYAVHWLYLKSPIQITPHRSSCSTAIIFVVMRLALPND
jgi:hypothetical protein